MPAIRRTAILSATIGNAEHERRRHMKCSWFFLPLCLFLAAGIASGQDVKALVESLKSGNGQAALNLVKQGAKGVPGLTDVLGEGTPFAQGHAARALGRIGPAAKEAVPALCKALAHQDLFVASEASL